MEGEEILNPGTPTPDVVYSAPGGGGGGSRTTLEAHDDDVVLLVLGPGASSAYGAATYTYTYPDLTSPTTRSNVPYTTDWTTAHGAHLPSGASVVPSQSVVGEYAYPDVVMAMAHAGSTLAPATRTRVPSTGAVIGESSSYTDMLMAHLSSSMYPANVAYPGSVTPSAAINGVAVATVAYPGGLNLNAVGFGNTVDVYQGTAGLGSERLHSTGGGTAAAAAATEPGGGYYYDDSGMVLPLAHPAVDEADMEGLVDDAADDQVVGAVAEPVRGGLGGLGLAATSLAMAGLIAGGVDTPVTAIALFGMLLAGVVLVTVRVFRA